MAGNKKTNRYNSGYGNKGRLAQLLDDVAEFEQYRAEILPKLRQFIKEGKSAESIYSWAQSYMAARSVSIAVGSKDEKAALAAIKEVLDRGVGKAADRVEITQKYEKLSDEELQALITSQEEDLKEDHSH